MNARHVLLCARDPAVVEAVEVSAAALDVALRVERDAARARAVWAEASVRLISTEVASRWSTVEAGQAYLVGASAAELARCSAELGLPVLPLPDENGRLAEAMLASVRETAPRGLVVAVAGASGGVGVSTLVVALALSAARRGARAVAVDLARASGGLDLLVGAEQAPGLRWADLTHARGELGDLALPEVDGVSLLAPSRESPDPPPAEALVAVLPALARTADLVVVDVGREPAPAGTDRTVLVVGGDVRSVSAARMLSGTAPAGVVVRTGLGRSLPPDVVARSLGAPLLGVLPEDRALPRLAELGLLPTAPPARRYRRRVEALWGVISGG